ncbi:MAG: hypothetical protein NVS3B28_12780 [Candidatus Velthaea sp.]
MNVPPGGVNAATTITVTEVPQPALPAPLDKTRRPQFTAGAGNTYVYAFSVGVGSGAQIVAPIALTGTSFTGLTAGTSLNIAMLSNGTWVDVGTLTANANGSFSSNLPSAVLHGVVAPGTYLIYRPAAGTSTAVANLGIALIADDGTLSTNGVQVVRLYDAAGNLLSTPTTSLIPYANQSDLDGAALTPDGSHGVVVDGGNSLGFFNSAQTGNPQPDAKPLLDVSKYGSDGDAVAISPNGDEAVAALEASDKSLLVISGVLSGAPTPATLLTGSTVADGLVQSADGTVMLARGSQGTAIDVWSIAPQTPAAGSLGGNLAHRYTLVKTLNGPAAASGDGRDGMAISPNDSTRALAVGVDASYNPVVNLITGLPSSATTIASAVLRTPRVASRAPRSERGERAPLTAITGGGNPTAVAISPDGTYAVVATSAGLVLVNGVNTGTLAQVGSVLQPAGASGANDMQTVAFTLDGRYVVTIVPSKTNSLLGTLLVIPVTSSGFGAIAAQLDGVAYPNNDQLLIH